MKKLAVILISLAVLVGRADAQDVVRRAGVQDLKYKVGQFSRSSRLTVGGVVSLDGLTPINALAYGVDNTGASACNDSLNALIDSVGAWGGGVIYCPAGTYRQNDEVIIDHDNITLMGDGMGATTFRPTWNAEKRAVIIRASNCIVTGIGVIGSACTGAQEAVGIAIEGGRHNVISYCMADSCDDSGICVGYDIDAYFAQDEVDRVNPSTAIDGVGHIVTGCIVTNTTEGTGIEIMRADSVIVSNNIVDTSTQYSIRVDASYGSTITGNILSGAGAEAISIQGYGDASAVGFLKTGVIKEPVGITVVGNSIRGTSGLRLFNGAADIIISSNIISGTTTTTGIILDKYHEWGNSSTLEHAWRNVSILGNQIIGGGSGIIIKGQGNGLTIRDNSIGDFYTTGIYFLAGSDNASADSNMVITDAVVGGNRIWIKDVDAEGSDKHGVVVKGDSVYVTMERNQFWFPSETANKYEFYGTHLYSRARAIQRFVKVEPHSIADFGVYGTGTALEYGRLNNAMSSMYNMAGADSTIWGQGIDLYFPGGTYSSTGVNRMLPPVRAVGPGVPYWLIGGRPRDLSGNRNPNGSVAAPIGSTFRRADADSAFLVKTSVGVSGWVLP